VHQPLRADLDAVGASLRSGLGDGTGAPFGPVTRNQPRPIACHARRFRPMVFRWVGLLQVRRMSVFECVALRPVMPGVVLTWFVTGFRTVEDRQF
jgi:hypothetical protein